MKAKLSVFSMIARHSLFRVFGILVALAGANGVLWYLQMQEGFQNPWILLDTEELSWVFIIMFLLMSLVLSGALRDKGGKLELFLGRLRLTPAEIYLTQSLYNALCCGLLFAVEALSLLGLCFWQQLWFPEGFHAQTVMMACYQSDLLHTFLPLYDYWGWACLVLLVLCFGFATAAMPAKNRRGRRSICTYLMCGTVVLYLAMQREYGAVNWDPKVITMILAAVFGVVAAVGAAGQEVEADG